MSDRPQLVPWTSEQRAAYRWRGREEHVRREVASGRFTESQAEAESLRIERLRRLTLETEPDGQELYDVVVDGDRAGTAWLARGPDGMEIRDLWVAEDHRGRGIGSTVLRQLTRRAWDLQRTPHGQGAATMPAIAAVVFTSDARSSGLFARAGFRTAYEVVETEPDRARPPFVIGRRPRAVEHRALMTAAEAARTAAGFDETRTLTVDGHRFTVASGLRHDGRSAIVRSEAPSPDRPAPGRLAEALVRWAKETGHTRLLVHVSPDEAPWFEACIWARWRICSRVLVYLPRRPDHRLARVVAEAPGSHRWECSCGAAGTASPDPDAASTAWVWHQVEPPDST